MKIGILGCRGIPNHYGGFEQFAEYLSKGLVVRGMEVWVYNSHNHPFKGNNWKGVNVIHCYDPEDKIGTAGQFIYDLNCILDSKKRDFDIIYQLGNTSSSIWHRFLPSKPFRICNMDGLEWMRSKYSDKVRKFLKYAERLAVKSNDLLIADSEAIQDYLLKTYNAPSTFIPYGAEVFNDPDVTKLVPFNLKSKEYLLLIARLQPDNHIEEIIKGVLLSKTELPLLVIGNYKNSFGQYIYNNYVSDKVKFLGPIFELDLLNQLRYYSKIYFHGHSSGGTNPSLLEAMASSSLIYAHDNVFNRAVLKENSFYFKDAIDIAELINKDIDENSKLSWITANINQLKSVYNWEKVIDSYYELFTDVNKQRN